MPRGLIDLSVSWTGQMETTSQILTWGAKVQNLRGGWVLVGEQLQRDFVSNFQAEGGKASDGGLGAKIAPKWAPLAQSTQERRRRLGLQGDHPILQRRGRLLASLTPGAMGADTVFEATDQGITVGTRVPYAIYHQMGTGKRSGRRWDFQQQRHREFATFRMPARRIVGLSWTSRSKIVGILDQYVKDQIPGALK